MPIKLRKNRNKNTYKVYNADTKEVHSYAATHENALKQKRLIDAIDSKKKKGAGLPHKRKYEGNDELERPSSLTTPPRAPPPRPITPVPRHIPIDTYRPNFDDEDVDDDEADPEHEQYYRGLLTAMEQMYRDCDPDDLHEVFYDFRTELEDMHYRGDLMDGYHLEDLLRRSNQLYHYYDTHPLAHGAGLKKKVRASKKKK